MFKKASDYKNQKLSIVVFGEPGAGKTSLVKTIKEKTLIIDAEHGLQSINDLDVDVFPLYEDSKGESVERIYRYRRLVDFIDYLKAGNLKDEGFKWIVIDSITEVSQNLIEHLKNVYEKKVREGMKENKFWIWGEYNDMITKLLKDLRDLKGYNVLCLSLVDTSKNEDGSKDKSLDMQGKISQRLPAIFDEVFYLDINKEDQRTLVTSKFKDLICKDRSGRLEKFEPADIGMIADKIRA